MSEAPTFIGHRGARFEAPENTISGFRYAIGLGLQALEFDVRMTADGQLVVIHDATIDRTTNGSGRVADSTLAELQLVDARAEFATWPERCWIPTLDQVLDTVATVPNLIVEIKSDTPDRLERVVPATVSAIEAHALTQQSVITSFDPMALEILAHYRPSIRRGLIGNWDSDSFLDRSVALGCFQVDAHIPSADPAIVERGRALGMRVVVWPCNDEAALRAAMAFEPDLICTDRPTEMGRLLASKQTEPSDPVLAP